MQFTTRITEDDYIAACHLKLRSTHRMIAGAIAWTLAAVLWLFYLAAWLSQRLYPASDDFLGQNASAFRSAVLPAAVMFTLWILIFRGMAPWLTRRRYRKAPYLHGEIVNEVSADGLAQKTSSGSFGFVAWKDLSYWRESNQMIIVVYPTNIFCILPKANLNEGEQTELRSILKAALPKK